MNDEAVLSLARREAGLSKIELRVGHGPDGFRIERDGNDHWIVHGGNARSCLWGVHHIKDGGGVGTFKPRFAVRGINPCETLARHDEPQLTRLINRMVGWRMNRLIVHHAYGYDRHAALIRRLCAERGIDIVPYLQSTLLFLREVTSEYFAQDEHGIPLTASLESETRLCVSNSNAVAMFRRSAEAYFGSDRIARSSNVVVIDADGYLFCQCASCRRLTSVQQWQILFEQVQDAAQAAQKKLTVHYLAYVWRYSLPDNPRLIKRLSGALFDVHQRYRWQPIGEPHELTYYNEIESQGDPRARSLPLNVYLRDRLKEWRDHVTGELCVFENLMLQGSISCPQPYTPQLIIDLNLYERHGVDGVIYEVFEPGIESFDQQLTVLSRTMWDRDYGYTPTPLELACSRLTNADNPAHHFKNCFNVLSYLTTERFDGLKLLRRQVSDPVLWAYAEHLRVFLNDRTEVSMQRVLGHVNLHRDRFDWMYIAFNLAHAVEPVLSGRAGHPLVQKMLATDKLCDLLEEVDNTFEVMSSIVDALLKPRSESCIHVEKSGSE